MKNSYKIILSFLLLVAIMQRSFAGGACTLTNGNTEVMNNTNCAITCPATINFYDSGNSGANYANSEAFTRTFTATAGNILQINFTAFQLESCCDRLYVYDGNSTAAPQVAGSPFTGATLPPNITTTGNTVTFQFTSDGSVTYLGWAATISCVAACSGTPTAGTAVSSVALLCGGSANLSLTGNVIASGLTYQWQSSTTSSTGPWTNIAGATTQTTTQSPTTTTWYACRITCTSSGNSQRSVAVQVACGISSAGTTNASVASVCGGSSFLSLTGNTTGAGVTYQWVSGPSNTGPWTNIAGVTISTTTVSPIVSTWYACNVTCSTCPTTVMSVPLQVTACPPCALTGTTSVNMSSQPCTITCPATISFYDTGGSGGSYLNSENYTKTFSATAGNLLQITFNSIGMESCCDRIYVYDGPTTASPQVPGSPFTGTIVPAAILTSSNTVTFQFTSDGSVVSTGWDATITCVSACSGTPTAGTSAASVTALCGGSTNLSLTGNTVASGLTYQWQSSTTSAAGPWTNIAGATALTTTQSPTATTWYACLVTCTSSGSSQRSVAVQITCGVGTAGTANASVTSVCGGSSFLSLTGNTTGAGITYQWVSGPSNTGPWTNIAAATASSTTVSPLVTTWYACSVNCTSCPGALISVPVQITACAPCVLSGTTTVNMSSQPCNLTCPANVTFYDTGGSAGTYANSENITKVFTASPGNLIQVSFTYLTLETCCDRIYIYDGPSTASPQVAGSPFNSTTLPPTFVSSGNAVTFQFTSDGSVTYAGWEANIVCFPPCSGAPIAGNTDATLNFACGGNTTLRLAGNLIASGLTYQWQSGPTSTGPWTNIAGATAMTYTTVVSNIYYRCAVTCTSSGLTSYSTPLQMVFDPLMAGNGTNNIILPYVATGESTCGALDEITPTNASPICASSLWYQGEDLVYVFNAPSTGVVNIMQTAITPAANNGMMLYRGCPLGGGLCIASSQNYNVAGSICANVEAGMDYFLVIDAYNSTCYSFDIFIDMVSALGSDCANADLIPALPYVATGLTTACSVNNYTSANACASSYMNGEDYVFEYRPLTNETISVTLSNTSSYTGVFITNGCPNGGTCVASATSITGNPMICSASLTAANTYYIIVDTQPNPQNTPFDIAVDVISSGPVSCGLNYSISSIAYTADPYSGTLVPGLTDDSFSSATSPLGFGGCFDGNSFADLLISSNGYLIYAPFTCVSNLPGGSTAGPSAYSAWSFSLPIPNTTEAPRNSIMGAYHDLMPPSGGAVYYTTLGVAPNRRFVVSYDNVAMYSCTAQQFRGQIKLYETSNIIEVHMEKKQACATWNNNNAIVGLHSFDGTMAIVPAGRNTSSWTTTNEAWRFTPACGTNCSPMILSARLIAFDAKPEGNANKVYWISASEKGSSYYEVEKSSDGMSFTKFSKVEARNDQSNANSYHVYDANPFEGTTYYRLNQVDVNGKSTYSTVVSVQNGEQNAVSVSIGPNPATTRVVIDIHNGLMDALPGEINVSNVYGQVVIKKNVEVETGVSAMELDISTLPVGVYFVKTTLGEQKPSVFRMIKN